MSTDIKLLIIVLLILIICGFVTYKVMTTKTKNYIASKIALTYTIGTFLGLLIMRRLLVPNDAIIAWWVVVACIFVFVWIFFAIRGVLASKSPNK